VLRHHGPPPEGRGRGRPEHLRRGVVARAARQLRGHLALAGPGRREAPIRSAHGRSSTSSLPKCPIFFYLAPTVACARRLIGETMKKGRASFLAALALGAAFTSLGCGAPPPPPPPPPPTTPPPVVAVPTNLDLVGAQLNIKTDIEFDVGKYEIRDT